MTERMVAPGQLARMDFCKKASEPASTEAVASSSNKILGVAEDSTGQAQELTLANGVVGAVVSDDGVELVLLVRDKFLEAN